MWLPPRVVVIAGSILLLGGVLYGSTLNHGIPYFPNLVVPIVVGGIGIGMISVPLTLSVIASVGFDRIGPTSAIAMMLQGLGGPVVLVVIQAVITSRTLQLGGTHGPVKFMNDAQLHALDRGYAYGLLCLAGVVVLLGGVALLIGYTAQQVAQAQEVKESHRRRGSSLMRSSCTPTAAAHVGAARGSPASTTRWAQLAARWCAGTALRPNHFGPQ